MKSDKRNAVTKVKSIHAQQRFTRSSITFVDPFVFLLDALPLKAVCPSGRSGLLSRAPEVRKQSMFEERERSGNWSGASGKTAGAERCAGEQKTTERERSA